MNSNEIAKLANVSRSTVSRVINNYANVPQETRDKVMKVIDEYGYTPNISARTLAGKANNIIGLFIADIDNNNSNGKWIGVNSPYNMEFISHVINSCKKKGYFTLVYTITNLKECQEMRQYFENRTIYGGIFIGFPYHTTEIEELSKEGYNVVLVDQLAKEDDIDGIYKLVDTDNITGGYTATKYLIDKGHKVIAHVEGDYRLSAIERRKGYEAALRESGIDVDDRLIVSGKYREDVAYSVTLDLLKNYKPTAIFVANDIMAVGVISAAKELGIDIPSQLSIVGYDNLDGSQWLDMNLTTMYTDLEKLAELSIESLFDSEVGTFKSSNSMIIERKSVYKK